MLIWLMLWIYKNYCGEDEYQKSRQINSLPYIYSTITYNTVTDDLHSAVRKTYSEYFDSSDNKAITYDESTHIAVDGNHLKEKSFELYHDKDNRKLTFYLDHRYFSGLFFMILGKNLFNVKPLNVMEEIYVPFLTEYHVLRFMYFMYFFASEEVTTKMITSVSDMRREKLNFNIRNTKYPNEKRKYRVIYNILNHVYTKLGTGKTLKVLIPVAFEASRERYNNVGAIFCHFDGNFRNMVTEIENNKYHAIASNILQRFSNKGKSARKLVDVVLSCGCFEGGEDYIDEFHVTYENIADYPIYCIATTYDDEVKTTITWMNLQ